MSDRTVRRFVERAYCADKPPNALAPMISRPSR